VKSSLTDRRTTWRDEFVVQLSSQTIASNRDCQVSRSQKRSGSEACKAQYLQLIPCGSYTSTTVGVNRRELQAVSEPQVSQPTVASDPSKFARSCSLTENDISRKGMVQI
jgi:hypothetical protein